MTKRLYIETVGCQMNVLDSEMVVANLRQHGYEVVQSTEDADVLLYNSCSVRQMAEEKIYSAVGEVKRIKEAHPDRVVGIMGCMAQKDQAKIFDRAPHVDLVIGPGQLHQIPDLIQQVRAGAGPQVMVSLGRKEGSQADIRRSHETFDPLRDPSMRPTPFQAYLRIQIGCDKFCTYCVVPMTRGPEQGRRPADILLEAQTLADQGCKEITLLGQTVNSYKYSEDGTTTRLADLLRSLHEIDGIERLKFVTNYPKDMTEDLLRTVHELPKCSPYLHVPAQSGSDEVLKRMKRGYTIADYRAMMERIHKFLPEASVSSDFIVGFCGETEEQFQMTMDLVREYRYKNSFIFQYSVREGTVANQRLEDDIPLDVKKRRNNDLLNLQNEICLEDNQRFVGETVQVLVEGPSKKAIKNGDDGPVVQMTGRTHCDRIVVFDGNRRQAGQMMDIVVREALCHTLIGTVHTKHLGPQVFQLA
ncbi:tRNA-2-methylthio-N(6)-dimethylallyladenosine synthase [Rosistilla oblonga]|uniref:tRNA-2-methylthio-N(6)-dimethylallyladenosine synthase n=1 Tax=Rosistilla oblonga TaxID=2527990 RepID=A0A518IY23_9BACT|nr:tRNA (N6-isopentenyl adenosine(37)-C2)-methylthiotransferase MiaB [Rosistilla oblonga]QDV13823.1 tRNA-2-methylthio-N(6)-dimethylallyladenosine synthase [Rosistilla oblonga]QDV57983.1 tRNA-2-methylthio-N(6)-dimethylallyladenosine synthase [Rosistilla oblonga]